MTANCFFLGHFLSSPILSCLDEYGFYFKQLSSWEDLFFKGVNSLLASFIRTDYSSIMNLNHFPVLLCSAMNESFQTYPPNLVAALDWLVLFSEDLLAIWGISSSAALLPSLASTHSYWSHINHVVVASLSLPASIWLFVGDTWFWCSCYL